MSTKEKKRRRRSPEEARGEILNAAETILLESGPAQLKFQLIAKKAGVSMSNAHHHFGGISEIQKALAERMLSRLTYDLATALASDEQDVRLRAEAVVKSTYDVIASERYAKLIAWITLSPGTAEVLGLLEPLTIIETMVTAKLSEYLGARVAARVTPGIIYRVAVTALGEGLIGEALKANLGNLPASFDGASALTASLPLEAEEAPE